MLLAELREDQNVRASTEGNDADRAWLLANVQAIDDCNRRIAELEAALREIASQCRVADDPEHMTLDLIRRIAEDATK